jgi:spore coat polysaccharide biosynthesis protein SpsF
MRIIATIEARMSSSRLPGKVLLNANNKPMLHHLVNRLRLVPSVDEIVLATTTNSADDVLQAFAIKEGLHFFRGSEDNVMQRVIAAAESQNADIIVELTGDNPLIDPDIIEQVIQVYLNNDCDYASNVEVRSYPIGMDVQVFSLAALKKSYEMTQDPLDLEHVTRHIRLSPNLFRQIHVPAPTSCHWPDLSLTLDEKADYELLKNIIEHFKETPDFNCSQIIELLKKTHQDWSTINSAVKRKGLHA